jgi:hypothetical protein
MWQLREVARGPVPAYRQQEDHDSAAQYLEIALANCSTSTPKFREELVIEAGVPSSSAQPSGLGPGVAEFGDRWKAAIEQILCGSFNFARQNRLKEAIAKVDEALRQIEKTSVGPSRTVQLRAFEKWRRELLDQKAGALAKPSA